MEKLLFTELRVLKSTNEGTGKSNQSTINRTGLELAFVDQENLKALGFALKEEGLVRLAEDYSKDPSLTPLYKKVMEFEPAIKVNPMYAGFPKQVLEMDELEFRVHQFIHYLTTYGMETLLGVEVTQGWLPETTDAVKRKVDEQLISLKVLDYLNEREINQFVINNLIGRKQRLLATELEIAIAVVKNKQRQAITDIPFKENIGALYQDILINGELLDLYVAFSELSKILKHPGDVLDLTEHLVATNKYRHLRTATKRVLVELFESFSTPAIEENLASNRWSKNFRGKKGRKRAINRNIALIDYMSYSRFSKNAEAARLVNELKDGSLLSWGQKLERAYDAKQFNTVLELLRQRPGVYFRQINRLYSLGVPALTMVADVRQFGGQLKTQSIVSTLNNYKKDAQVTRVFYEALVANLASKNVEALAGKKVYIEKSEFDLSASRISILEKSNEGGYIQNGLAIRVPEVAKVVRFFTYWNDKRRIDIDLHAAYNMEDGGFGHVGFYGNFRDRGVVHSGDITHSNAAEYVDVDLDVALARGVKSLQFNINSFTRVPFKDIETVFTGLMLVGKAKDEVKLYDGKNVLFRHDLNGDYMSVNYAYLDVKARLLYILGDDSKERNDRNLVDGFDVKLSIQNYLDVLLATQGATVVENKEDAEVILGLPKSDDENYYSLIDENYFMGVE